MPHEEEWIALLAACDRALETGADPGVSSGAGLSAEWQARLGRSLSCIRLLRRALERLQQELEGLL